MIPFFCQPAFRIKRGGAAGAGGRHGLAIVIVGDIAGGEHAFDAGPCSLRLGPDNVAFRIELKLAREKVRVGRVSDCEKYATGVELLLSTVDGAFEPWPRAP